MSGQGNTGEAGATASAPKAFSFAVLGQSVPDIPDRDLDYQDRRDAHFSARKACAMLKVTSAIVNAVVVHPGGDCDEVQLAETTRELMRRSSELTDAASELLDIGPDHPGYAGYRNLLRQSAAEVVATQWRMANSIGGSELSVERITSMFRVVLDSGQIEKEGEVPPYPADLDATTAKRLAILGVVPEIYSAVNGFDYFANPEALVEKGVKLAVQVADDGVRRIATPKAGPDALTMLTQSLIGKAGVLYATNYRAIARRDVLALQNMDAVERQRHIHNHRDSGLPTAHVDEAFAKLMTRMIDMVCENVPELASGAMQPQAPRGAPGPANPSQAPEAQPNDFKPE